MSVSEEIKIEALKSSTVRFGEISILYTSRLGEIRPHRRHVNPVLEFEGADASGSQQIRKAVIRHCA